MCSKTQLKHIYSCLGIYLSVRLSIYLSVCLCTSIETSQLFIFVENKRNFTGFS